MPGDDGQVAAERELGDSVPHAGPPLGGVQLPPPPRPRPALGPHDLRVRQQPPPEVALQGSYPPPPALGRVTNSCVLQGRYPRFTGRQLRGVINRTMTLRED